jgi:hypothetical protein
VLDRGYERLAFAEKKDHRYCVCVCTYRCMCAYTYIFVCVNICIYIYMYIHACMQTLYKICMYARLRKYIYIYRYMCWCMYACMHLQFAMCNTLMRSSACIRVLYKSLLIHILVNGTLTSHTLVHCNSQWDFHVYIYVCMYLCMCKFLLSACMMLVYCNSQS